MVGELLIFVSQSAGRGATQEGGLKVAVTRTRTKDQETGMCKWKRGGRA